MSKALDNLTVQLANLSNELEKEKKNNERLRELCYKLESQDARRMLNTTRSDSELFRKRFKDILFNDYMETAVSIIIWNGLPESFRNIFNSKRIESQIAKFGSVAIFPHKYTFQDGNNRTVTNKVYLALPFVGVAGFIDCYNEFQLIRPYSASSWLAYSDAERAAEGSPYGELVVNEDCVIVSDYYNYGQTNGNASFTIGLAIDMYCKLIADCEAAKRINRNWLKIPFLFNADGTEDSKEINKMISEIEQLVAGVEENQPAIISKYARNLELLPTGAQYFGEQLTQCIKDYKNDLDEFLGIGHIKNENRARKITAEFTNTSDQYNINISKRLANRQLAIDRGKKIWNDWKNISLDVNLIAYTSPDDETIEEDITDDISE